MSIVPARPALLALFALAACSPALNWREVRVHSLLALLPCKPDSAQRSIRLAGQDTTLQMSGCEAGGAMFAISHAAIDEPDHADAVRDAWRSALLANLRTTTATPVPAAPAVWSAQGQAQDGTALQAQFTWIARGQDLYHLAVYAKQLTPAMTDPFFSESKVP